MPMPLERRGRGSRQTACTRLFVLRNHGAQRWRCLLELRPSMFASTNVLVSRNGHILEAHGWCRAQSLRKQSLVLFQTPCFVAGAAALSWLGCAQVAEKSFEGLGEGKRSSSDRCRRHEHSEERQHTPVTRDRWGGRRWTDRMTRVRGFGPFRKVGSAQRDMSLCVGVVGVTTRVFLGA